ncbi:MAG TPA: GAF domain-containing protein, partial [Anaerolineae bacterium]|nr:GAF domain-containing protein [Anaerolineae bacterium]
MTITRQELERYLAQGYAEMTQHDAPATATAIGEACAASGFPRGQIAALQKTALHKLLEEIPGAPLSDVAPHLSALLEDMLAGYDAVARQHPQPIDARDVERAAELQWTRQELEAQNARLASLSRLGRTINATFEINAIFELLAKEAMLITGAAHGTVLLVNEAEGYQEINQLLGFTPEETALAMSTPLVLGKGLIGYAHEHQCIVVVDDVRQDPRYWEFVPSTRAELVLPIIHEGKVLAQLDLQSPEVGAFRSV